MDRLNAFSRRCLFWALLLNLLFMGAIVAAIHFAAVVIFKDVAFAEIMGILSRSQATAGWVEQMLPLFAVVRSFFVPSAAGAFILLALIQWLILRGSFKRVMKKTAKSEAAHRKEKAKDREAMEKEPRDEGMHKKERQEQNKRYYLHLLSVLQREGRLIDFFREDLSAYGDAQIGAAVRSIHENCAKTIEKYLAPRKVMNKPEGEQVSVPGDFDPSAIKLTGNVTGEPPFTGILRHQGWRAGKVELPVLSGGGDPQIIAPAEVEIS